MMKIISLSLIFALITLINFHNTLSSTSVEINEDEHIYPSVDPLPLLSLRIKPNQISAGCSYRVEITTGCSSVPYTRDQIGLSFGDAYGTQVYVPRIDDPKSGTFEACSTDTFDISGPCTRDICYVYLYRRGQDGWNVGSVKISSKHTRTVTFNFKHWVPNDVWWGFNYCNGAFASPIL
ncbi:hypothetical protein RND81_07G108400 [Saponaria officinalis]|uniref:Uncharacterized protein n=1 Tax=Saponaria officinalis TaxID=3572 RepID=A0AAW1JTU2_SAPOF